MEWLQLRSNGNAKTQVGLRNAKTQVNLRNAKTRVGLRNAKTQVPSETKADLQL